LKMPYIRNSTPMYRAAAGDVATRSAHEPPENPSVFSSLAHARWWISRVLSAEMLNGTTGDCSSP
jgi:hypothetical protein